MYNPKKIKFKEILHQEDNSASLKITFDDDEYTYQGDIDDSINLEGYGKLWNAIYNYHGHFKNNNFHGNGYQEYMGDKSNLNDKFVISYRGDFVNNKKCGEGIEYYSNDEYYIGSFKDNLKHGIGTMFNKNGKTKLKGNWNFGDSIQVSSITEYYDNGNLKYKGEYDGYNMHGIGVLCNEDGSMLFEGEFNKGYKKKGKLYENNVLIFDGLFDQFNNKTIPLKGNFYHNNGVKMCSGEVIINNSIIYLDTKEIINNKNNTIFIGKMNYNDNYKFTKKKNFINDTKVNELSIILKNKLKINGIEINYNFKSGKYFSFDDKYNKSNDTYNFNINDAGYLDGLFEINNNNNKFIEFNFSNGNLNGMYTEFYQTGIIKHKILYNINVIIYDKEFSKSGKLCRNIMYENNIPYSMELFFENNNKNYIGNINTNYQYNGQGILYYANEENTINYDGNFSKGKFNGNGILYYLNGNKAYEGQFLNGKKHGDGTSYYEANEVINYQGKWKNDEKHGEGSIFTESGDLVYIGQFNLDEMA